MVAKGSVLFKNTISRSLQVSQVSNEVKHKIIDNMPDFSRGLTSNVYHGSSPSASLFSRMIVHILDFSIRFIFGWMPKDKLSNW